MVCDVSVIIPSFCGLKTRVMRSFPSISVYQKTRYNYSCTEFDTIPASRAHRYPFVHLLVGGVAPQTPVSRSPSSCGCASFCGKTLFSKNRICVQFRYRSCFFCAAPSLCSIGSFRIRSTFARTVSSSRISSFAALYSA